MNLKIISYFLGWVLKIESIAFALSGIVSVWAGDTYWYWLFILAVVVFGIGVFMSPKRFSLGTFYSREGYAATALGWLVLSLVGAVPFVITGKIPNYIDAVFEIASGFTTTGASILDEVEHLGKGLLFFRSFSHWVGGMGVLVLILAILPFGGTGNHMQLMKAESPGPQVSKLVPRVRETALVLYGIYIVLTLIMVVTYLIAGMPLFDALCIGFGTAGTGGFTVRNTGMEDYSNLAIVFSSIWMFLFAVNFNVYYLVLNKKWKDALKSEELRAYTGMVLIAVLLIFAALTIRELRTPVITYYDHTNLVPSYGANFREAFFTVTSTVSSTGFTLPVLYKFGGLSRYVVILLMIIGACGGSTGGGLKVSRVVILIKSAGREIHMLMHPNSVKLLKFEGKTLDNNTARSVSNYLMIFVLVFAISLFIVLADPNVNSFTQGFTSVLTCINNIGPCFGENGEWICSLSHYNWLSKLVLTFDMIAGRLEFLPMLLLFNPKTWKKTY